MWLVVPGQPPHDAQNLAITRSSRAIASHAQHSCLRFPMLAAGNRKCWSNGVSRLVQHGMQALRIWLVVEARMVFVRLRMPHNPVKASRS